MKCDFCGKDESLPFVCNYCGNAFCADHRLPEAHQCKGDLTQKRTIAAPTQTTFSWQTPPMSTPYPGQARRSVYSKIEVRDIVVAWVALGIAFAMANTFSIFAGGYAGPGIAIYFLVSMVTVGPGFVLHELSHKFVAQRHGFWAEFRMWPMGLVLALVTSLLGFIFAAPGATYISGANISKEQNGEISIAGPLVNIGIGALFLPLAVFAPGGTLIQFTGVLGAYVNIFLALFNLLPIGPLDGSKVLHWSIPIWIATFVPTAAAFYYLFFA